MYGILLTGPLLQTLPRFTLPSSFNSTTRFVRVFLHSHTPAPQSQHGFYRRPTLVPFSLHRDRQPSHHVVVLHLYYHSPLRIRRSYRARQYTPVLRTRSTCAVLAIASSTTATHRTLTTAFLHIDIVRGLFTPTSPGHRLIPFSTQLSPPLRRL